MKRLKIVLLIALLVITIAAQAQVNYSWLGNTSTNWSTASNWNPSGIPGSNDTVTIAGSSYTYNPVLDQNRTIAGFRLTGAASVNLSGNSLTVTDTTTLTAGTISNGILHFNNRTTVFEGTMFNCRISVISQSIEFNGSIFNNVVQATYYWNNSYERFSSSEGGNTFNDSLLITNNSNRGVRMATIAGDLYNGNVVVSNSEDKGSIIFGGSNSITKLANGKTITIGSNGFTDALLGFINFQQVGNTPQTLNLTGSSTLLLGLPRGYWGTSWGGDVNFTAPSIQLGTSTFYGNATFTKTGTRSNSWQGGNKFYGKSIVNLNGSGYLFLNAGNTIFLSENYYGDVEYNVNSTGKIYPANSGITFYHGNVSIATNNQSVIFGNDDGFAAFSGSNTQYFSKTGTGHIAFSKLAMVKPADDFISFTPIEVNSTLYLESGKIVTDTVKLSTDDIPEGNINSFVDGLVMYKTITPITNELVLPTGNNNNYQPVKITTTDTTSGECTFTARYFNHQQASGLNTDTTLANLSGCEYWKIGQIGSSIIPTKLKLGWNTNSCNGATPANMRIAQWDNTKWINVGNTNYTGDYESGEVTSDTLTNFGYLTLANIPCAISPVINSTAPTSGCGQGAPELTASDGLYYTWSNGLTNQTIIASDTGLYSVLVRDYDGCSGVATQHVSIEPYIHVADTIIILPNTETNLGGSPTASGGTPPYSYLWEGPCVYSQEANPTLMIDFWCAGNRINLSVTDSLGCVNTHPVFIDAYKPELTVSFSGCADSILTVCLDSAELWVGKHIVLAGGTFVNCNNAIPIEAGMNCITCKLASLENDNWGEIIAVVYDFDNGTNFGTYATDTAYAWPTSLYIHNNMYGCDINYSGELYYNTIGGNLTWLQNYYLIDWGHLDSLGNRSTTEGILDDSGVLPLNHSFPSEGVYDITVKTSYSACADTLVQNGKITIKSGIILQGNAWANCSDEFSHGYLLVNSACFQSSYSYYDDLRLVWDFGNGDRDSSLVEMREWILYDNYAWDSTYNAKVYLVLASNPSIIIDSSTVEITTPQKPNLFAGDDLHIVTGDTVQLNTQFTSYYTGSLGSINEYSWSPAAGLSASNIANPFAFPDSTTEYVVTVTSLDQCIFRDTLRVYVCPNIIVDAGVDTVIFVRDTIQLNATALGGTSPYSYEWTPSTGLSSTTVANPFVYPDTTTDYIVKVTDSNGCSKRDTINVRFGFAWLSIEALTCAGVDNNILICADLFDTYLQPGSNYEIHISGVSTDCGSEVPYTPGLFVPLIIRPTDNQPLARRCFLCTAPTSGTVTIKLWNNNCPPSGCYEAWPENGNYDPFTGVGLVYEASAFVPSSAEPNTPTLGSNIICEAEDAVINIPGFFDESDQIFIDWDYDAANPSFIDVGSNPPFTYNDYPPGTYTIAVKAIRCCMGIDEFAELDVASEVCDEEITTFEITVQPIEFELPEKACIGGQLTIDNLGCFDPSTLTITYDFDGGLQTIGPTTNTSIQVPTTLAPGEHLLTITVSNGNNVIYENPFEIHLENCCYWDAAGNVDISFQKASDIYHTWHAGQVTGNPTIYDNIVGVSSGPNNLIFKTGYTTGTIFAPDPNTASISINGTFICDIQNVTFDQAHVVLGTNAKIEFDQTGSTRTLNIENSWLHACGLYLWDGIYVNSSTPSPVNRILNVDNSLIEDAINAVVSYNCGDYNVSDSRFNKNYKHIIANICTPITHPSTVYGTTFECNGGSGNILPALPALPGNPTKTKYAIEVNDQNSMVIGVGTESPNYFHESDVGIYSTASGLRVFNNVFEDYYGGVHNTTPQTWIDNLGTLIIPYKGTAIYYTGTPYRTVALTLNGANTSSNNTNSFINCTRGVFTVGNARLNISGNTFDNGYCPIYVWNNIASNIAIKRNVIDFSVSPSFSFNRFGIFLNNIGQSNTIIQSNRLTCNNLILANLAVYHATGISVWQPAMGGINAYNTLDISKNTITEPQIGIRLVGVKGRKGDDTRDINIYANRIDILENPQASNNLRYGIFNQDTKYAHIQNNWVSSSTATIDDIEGIRNESSPTSYIYCNYLNLDGTTNNSTNGLGGAITFNYNSLSSKFFNNQMQNSKIGVGTYSGAITGNQASLTRISGNKWIVGTGLTNFTNGRVLSQQTNNSNYTIYTDGSLSALDFDPNYLGGNIGVPTTSKFNLSYPTSNFWTYDCEELKWTWPSPDDGSGTPKALAREIIEDSLNYPVFSTSSRYLSKVIAYSWIKEYPDSMLTDTVIGSFYSANLTTNIGKLWAVDSLFDSYIIDIRNDISDSIYVPKDSADYLTPSFAIDTATVNDIETGLLSITPQNRVEQAKVTVCLAMVNALKRSINPDSTYAPDNVYTLNFTTAEWDSIQNYAYLCAYEYGPAVYTARNLMGSVGDSLMNYWAAYVNPCELGDTSWARTMHTDNSNTENSKVLLYPNPTTGNVFIKLPENIERGTIQLFSANGAVLQTLNITNTLMELDLGKYANGLYIIRIFDSNNSYLDSKKVSLLR